MSHQVLKRRPVRNFLILVSTTWWQRMYWRLHWKNKTALCALWITWTIMQWRICWKVSSRSFFNSIYLKIIKNVFGSFLGFIIVHTDKLRPYISWAHLDGMEASQMKLQFAKNWQTCQNVKKKLLVKRWRVACGTQ